MCHHGLPTLEIRRIAAEKQLEEEKHREAAIGELANGQSYMEEELRKKMEEVERMVTDPSYFSDEIY